MSEVFTGGPSFPEDLMPVRDKLLAQNEANMASGELDGLEELREEVATDPLALNAYIEATKRTESLAE